MTAPSFDRCPECGFFHGQGGCKGAPPARADGVRLGELLRECGLTGAELARRADVHENTVSNWRNGHVPTPGIVFAYLELLAKVRSAAR